MGLAIVIIIFCVVMYIYVLLPILNKNIENQRKDAESSISNLVSYNEKDEILKVYGCSPQFKSAIVILENKGASLNHVPEELWIGSATVGGVTTGGTFTTGGYDEVDLHSAGTYSLMYKGKKIKKIELTAELYSMAQQSEVRSYLGGNNQLLVVCNDRLSANEQELLGMLMKQGIMPAHLIYKGYPSKEKCVAIVNFLTGKK